MNARLLLLILFASSALHAQLAPLAPISFDTSGPVLRNGAQSQKPFTVAGEHGVLLGQQDGTLEAWILPIKLFSHLTIQADIANYPVPIDVNQHAASIEVRPDRTIITYSHIGFTVRQIMFSPSVPSVAGVGPVILYQFDCLHPTDFTFRFTPELQWMWPERNDGVPGVEWEPHPYTHALPSGQTGAPADRSTSAGISGAPADRSTSAGLYILHTDYPDLAAAITIPGAEPGILTPYQERPQVHPVELKLHIDPARDRDRLFPLLMAIGTDRASATSAALAATLAHLNAAIPAAYAAHAQRYTDLLAHSVSIDTPDKSLDQAFQWAVISIEQLRTAVYQPQDAGAPGPSVRTGEGATPGAPGLDSETGEGTTPATGPHVAGAAESALVAGYYTSADSARPGFGWFFGRDALYTLYAVNGFGDFALTRDELEFLIRRQRTDGKIMHEYSQTAAAIDWQAFPYMYAAADSTPLFLMAMADYIRASGDTAFLAAHRDAIEKAWAFETDPAHDTDHDGIYDNSQGTGWVESWPGGLPHQEIYLALLDQQASSAYEYLQSLLHNQKDAQAAQARAAAIAETVNREYYDPQKGCYAFATNPAGIPVIGLPPGQTSPNTPVDRTTTIYPSLAWWDPAAQTPILNHPDPCLRNFVSSALNTDWGARDIANNEKDYDGMSYHQGSVWPLFTGWAALAEYRGNQPLAGYQLLKENANLTTTQDLGAVTELLSGDFFVPFGRSTSHQLWSSAMVVTPTLRGLFGISIDAPNKTITVNPHLPASWDHAAIRNLHIGDETIDLNFVRSKGTITVSMRNPEAGIRLVSSEIGAKSAPGGHIVIPDHAVQINPAFQPPLPGNRTESPRVLDEQYSDRKLTLTLEGPAGTEAIIPLIVATPRLSLHVTGASLSPRPDPKASQAVPYIVCSFPHGPSVATAWQTIAVTLTW